MRRRVLGLGGLVVVSLAAAVVWPRRSGPPAVTEAEARAYLRQIVAAGLAHDFTTLCSLNGAVSNCQTQLDLAGRDAVPPQPPNVVGSRYDPKDSKDDTPAMILVVDGIDGRGKPYRTEVAVFREDRDHFKAINAVYWSNFKILGPDGQTSPR
jgi:hypothetical protein